LTVERKLEEVLPRSRTEWEARLATAHHVLVGVNGAGGGGGVAGGGGRQAEATENWEAVGAAGEGERALKLQVRCLCEAVGRGGGENPNNICLNIL